MPSAIRKASTMPLWPPSRNPPVTNRPVNAAINKPVRIMLILKTSNL